jgi:type IV pilus assembly protein PilA
MNSVKCSACGFVGWGGVAACKKCGSPLVPHSASSPAQSLSFINSQQYGRPANGELKKGLAISSLVIGILNFFTLGFLGVGIILGITLALVALSKIKNNPSVYGGKELATAGLITSILSVLIIVPIGIIAAIAIPNLLASRRAANEGSAVQALQKISVAEATYANTRSGYGTLEQLGAEGLISKEIAAGTRWGYLIRIDVSKPDSRSPVGRFQVVAVPVTYGNSARRSFFLDETGVIRTGDAQGKDATEFDEPLENSDGEYPSRGPASRRRDPVNAY